MINVVMRNAANMSLIRLNVVCLVIIILNKFFAECCHVVIRLEVILVDIIILHVVTLHVILLNIIMMSVDRLIVLLMNAV